ncbi:SixA phosphatase family protein [Geodermatophilus ruber]|uniref:Phosphohistidine phosphatase n=1 Tax=Geodermatophilus ruber TaxID=504800 RepID=A0A1I4AL51_9ACTN|nr:histidine phosphatase family protein [Geodermatophilus ruber]SFK57252.1 phosphohistidine phosphatase [Geodermatophilus ruber]
MQPRRLLLIRHAQAAHGPVDVDRPLTEPGARHAAALGTWLAQAGLTPDRVLVSPARRAAQTWEQASAALAAGPQPIVDARIYDNSLDSLLAAIRETPEEVTTLAVVGHNPSLAELAGALDDGQGSPTARRDARAGFRTGAVAVFLPAPPFAALEPGAATLGDFAVPGD